MKIRHTSYKSTVLINYPKPVSVRKVESLLRRKDAKAKKDLAHVIYHRLYNRYIIPLNEIRYEKQSGFLIMAAACLLIEALQSFRQGYEYTRKSGAGEKCFTKFFSQHEAFASLRPLSSNFYSNIRCGILHQAETYGNWLIWKGDGTPLFYFHQGNYVINADIFLEELANSIEKYRKELAVADWDNKLWVRAKRKLTKICEHCRPAVLQLNLHRKFFDRIAAGIKRTEYRSQTPYWKKRLHRRKYDLIKFRNGYATRAPEMQVEFHGVRRVRKWGKDYYAIRLGRILRIKRWRNKR